MAISKFCILIVDDQLEATASLKAMLERRDFECVSAVNTKEATEKLETHLPHVMIVDVNLGPDDNGLDWLEKVRSGPYANVPAIMLTGAGDVETIKKSARIGVDDYIVKPAGHTTLSKKIVAIQARLQIETPYAIKTSETPLPVKATFTARISALSETGLCISSHIMNRKPISFPSPRTSLFDELQVGALKKLTFLNNEREANQRSPYPIRNFCQASGWSEPDFKNIRLWVRRNKLGRTF